MAKQYSEAQSAEIKRLTKEILTLISNDSENGLSDNDKTALSSAINSNDNQELIKNMLVYLTKYFNCSFGITDDTQSAGNNTGQSASNLN